MPDISYEALAGAALVIVLAVGYQYLPKADAEAGAGSASSGKSKKKNKKKAKGGKEAVEEESDRSGSASEAGKKVGETVKGKAKDKPKKGKADRHDDGAAAPAPVPAPITPEADAPSFAEVAKEGTDQDEQTPKPKTLAQKLGSKNRKTKVDETDPEVVKKARGMEAEADGYSSGLKTMLAPEDRPAEHARVMKVVNKDTPAAKASPPPPAPAPVEAPKASEKIAKYEEDYLEGDDTTSGSGTIEDDGWDVVPSKKKKAFSISNSSSAATSTTAPLPVDTKIQRKNAKKSEEKKAIKDAEEADRLKRLSQHRKTLEKERIAEIYKSNKSASGKTNGGAFASLDTNGKLVWD